MKLTKSKLKEMILEEMNEAREIGGYYMMKQLKDLARDAKRSGEKKVAKALMFLHDRINQSSRDIDLNADDLNDFLKDPRGRKYGKDLPDWMIDSLFESDLPTTTKKDKTVTVVHKTSGKELVVTDTSSTRKKYKRMGYFVQADPRKIKKALMIAKKMSGDMTGAVKKIERIEKDLSNNHDVANALKTANESINEETSDKEAALEVIDYVKQALNATKSKKPYAKDWYSTAMQGVLQYWGGRVAKDLGIRDDVEKIAYQSSIGKTDPSGWKTGSPSKKNQKAVEKILKKAEKNFKKIKEGRLKEGNPTPAVQKKLIKIFKNDPLYKDVIMSKNSKEFKKAIDTLRSIRGPNAIKLLKKHSKKLMGKDY